MYINRRCINNRMFTLVYMQCVQSCRLIFHAAVFRHLSLKIMAAIKHFPAFFPALFWCVCVCVCGVSPAVVRGTLCHFLLSLFPSFRRLFFAVPPLCLSPSVCLSNLICGNFFAIFPTSPSVPRPPPSPAATVSFVSANVWQFI